MNLRFGFIILVLAFLALLLAIGVLTAIRWIRMHYPERANAILAGGAAIVAGAVVMTILELNDRPLFRPHDLITLQEPVVARTIPVDRAAGSVTCIVDLHEHLGVLEIEVEQGALKARVESNNTSAPVFCPVGAEVRIDLNWLRRLTVTRRQTQVSGS
ncbi:MAG: hypothetical protein LZF60_80310 [Nitrospira sp.]|nr:hypothetical protein [Nitrospira sp.]ULA58916.1 MAG: hypothetical protein LZF60_80310 [Nitrospira sp.]